MTRRAATARITAADQGDTLTLSLGGTITASTTTRTLAGPVVRYGVYGRTSRGRLKVAPGALRFPTELTRVKLTEEHDRGKSRGYMAAVTDDGDTIRASMRVSDGPLGDAALAEAADHTRDGFSFDVVDATVDGDTITDALVIAIGQVGIPAFDDMRIDTIAASQTPSTTPTPMEGTTPMRMTAAQRARLIELRDKANRSDTEATELAQLTELAVAEVGTEPEPAAPAEPAAAPAATPPADSAPVTASVPQLPGGVPQRPAARTSQAGALQTFVDTVTAALAPGGGGQAAITAALTDITNTGNPSISMPAWSGELWSGLVYESVFTPLLNSGDLTNYEGKGWRFGTKPVMGDYAGDKAAIPSGPVTTESSDYEAARMAVGHDIDRKFYDFPDAAFLAGYVEAVRESWAIRLDDKVRAYIETNAVPVTEAAAPATRATLIKAAARAVRGVKQSTRARATFVLVNDDDLETLLDVTADDVPAFLALYNIDPNNFVGSDTVAQGTVLAGVKQAATVRTLPGSPIRVSAQNLANGGIDEAFFGYWAVETHHVSGIRSVQFTG